MTEHKKEKQKIYGARWHQKNAVRRRKQIHDRRRELSIWFREYKKTLKCSRCPEDHPNCLEFHHKDPTQKDINIAEAPESGWSKARILKEVAKCEILCANCHRKEHYQL